MSLDIYLSSLSNEEYDSVSSKLDYNFKSLPLLSWDIYSQNRQVNLLESQQEQDILKVKALASTFNWNNDIDSIFSDSDYEALIVTDVTQNILWVNNGFPKMTGYSKGDALNKTPRFLQGEKTTEKKRDIIRKKLSSNLPFQEVIINHKKDGTPYTCEVKIIPLFTNNIKTHYIALEKQVV